MRRLRDLRLDPSPVLGSATALTLLWAPLPKERAPAERAWGPLSDLFFGTFVHWDAHWFLQIARDGYNATSAAFFPLYPLVLHAARVVDRGGDARVARGRRGRRVGRRRGSRRSSRADAVLLLALFPTAYVFSSVYSDGALPRALGVGVPVRAARPRGAAGIAGGLACATRLLGLALLPALVLLLWPRRREDAWRLAPLLLLPLAVAAYACTSTGSSATRSRSRRRSSGWERETPALGPLTGLWWAIEAGGHGGLEVLRHLPRGQGLHACAAIRFWNAAHLVLLAGGGVADVGRVAAGVARGGPLLARDARRRPRGAVAGGSRSSRCRASCSPTSRSCSRSPRSSRAAAGAAVGARRLRRACAVAGVAFSRGIWVA